jgi:hypothetical protein
MNRTPLYRILLLFGFCLLVAGLVLPQFPFNGLVALVGLICGCIGYVLYPIQGWPERVLQILIGIVFLLFILTYFYAPSWLPRAILELADPLLRIFMVATLGMGIYVWYRQLRRAKR